MKKIIYFAGPLFTQAERMWNLRLSEIIKTKRNDIEIFLPQEREKEAIVDGILDFSKIFRICIDGINSSDIVVAVLDGSDSDSGTCFECGYAFSKGKPVIGVRTDIRGGEDNGLNAMLNHGCNSVIHYGSGEDPEKDMEKLAQLIIADIDSHSV
ncbi:MAG: nucleoside 2-deoxyribosyltransferase [Desulfobacteraceae bacterium]|jgi:nucleoside 2-deoxyribosyltransferase